MKSNIFRIALVAVLAIQVVSCSKDNGGSNNGEAKIQTTPVTTINYRSVKTGGAIEASSSEVIQRGVCYSETPNPTITHSITKDGTGLGTFNSNINQLSANKKYFLRAYMVNKSGTYYGNEFEFVTPDYPKENIWWLNESIFVINDQSVIPGFTWSNEKNAFVGIDNVVSEFNFLTLSFKPKPTENKTYKVINSLDTNKVLASDECFLQLTSSKKPYVGTYLYSESTPHSFQVTIENGKATINISDLVLYEKNDAGKTTPVKFKAVLKEK